MQRHFSNRGEPLPEVVAARWMGHRMSPAKSVRPGQRGEGVTPGPWKTQPSTEAVRTTVETKKTEPRRSGKSGLNPPEL